MDNPFDDLDVDDEYSDSATHDGWQELKSYTGFNTDSPSAIRGVFLQAPRIRITKEMAMEIYNLPLGFFDEPDVFDQRLADLPK